MKELHPWIPAIGAGSVMILALILGTHVRYSPARLQSWPRTVQVRPSDVADLKAELSAPLFTPSRTVAASNTNPAVPSAPLPQLEGIVLGAGKAVALVKGANVGDVQMLHAGDAIDGWTIVGIGARQITVARGGEKQTVALEFGTRAAEAGGHVDGAEGGPAGIASPSFDGLAAARRLGLPEANIPRGSPLESPR